MWLSLYCLKAEREIVKRGAGRRREEDERRGDAGGLGQEQPGSFTASWHFLLACVFACLTWTNIKCETILCMFFFSHKGRCEALSTEKQLWFLLVFCFLCVWIIVEVLFLTVRLRSLRCHKGLLEKKEREMAPCKKNGSVYSYINLTHPSWQSLGEAWQTCIHTQAVQIQA